MSVGVPVAVNALKLPLGSPQSTNDISSDEHRLNRPYTSDRSDSDPAVATRSYGQPGSEARSGHTVTRGGWDDPTAAVRAVLKSGKKPATHRIQAVSLH